MKFCKISVPYLVFISICFIGCAYHVYEVTRVFFAFQTKIDVSFEYPKEIMVPMASFCSLTYSSLKNQNSMIPFFSTPSIIDNLTFDVSDVFFLCSTDTFEEGCKGNNDVLQIEKVINHEYICFTFKYPKTKMSLSRKELRDKNGLIYLFILNNHPMQIYGYQLYLSSEYNVPNGDSLNFYQVSGK